MFYILLLFFGTIIYYLGPTYLKYSQSDYQEASGNGFLRTVFNKGNYGEFLTFIKIESLKEYGHILTNIYLPTKDGMTEVDLVFIHPTGVYVFESKNYSGWIFGNENHKEWTQSLPNKQKFKFYNPIWQNRGHISAIKEATSLIDEAFCSYIVFSERCTLKKIEKYSAQVKVVSRTDLAKDLRDEIKGAKAKFKVEEVEMLAMTLRTHCHASKEMKESHVRRLEAR